MEFGGEKIRKVYKAGKCAKFLEEKKWFSLVGAQRI